MILTSKTLSETILFLCLVKLISFLLFETIFLLFSLIFFENSPESCTVIKCALNYD